MTEYIELKAAVDLAMQYCPDDDGACSKADRDIRELLDELEALPAADVAPVAHSRWIKTADGAECERCGREVVYQTIFCPHCGAKMDGKREE